MRPVFIVILSVAALASCAPIPVPWYASRGEQQNDTFYLNNGNQVLTVRLQQKHFPNNEIKNELDLRLRNASGEMIQAGDLPWFRITSRYDLLDSAQFALLAAGNKTSLQPQEQLQLDLSYWSKTFKDDFQELVQRLRQETATLHISYTVNNRIFRDSVLFRPELQRFEKVR